MIYLLIASLIFIVDFYIKTRIEAARKKDFPISLRDGQIELVRRHNKGLAGSRMEDKPGLTFFLSGSALAVCFLLSLLRFFRRGGRLEKLSLAFILGGAAGNFFDRLGRGYVVDYLTFPKARIKQIRRFVYNLADLFIFFGSAVLFVRDLLCTIFRSR